MRKIFLILFLLSITNIAFAQDDQKTRTIIDMRNEKVTFPAELKKVATIDDGFVESVMTHLGEIEKVTAISSWGMKRDYKYNFETLAGEQYSHHGWSTMKYLNPWLNRLPCFNSQHGDILNFETLAMVKPDLVIMRVGDCTVGDDQEKVTKTINTINQLGLPLAVIYAPGYSKKADLSTIKDEMLVIGDIFDQKTKAATLANYLASTEQMIKERTASIPNEKKVKVLFLGLNPDLRKQGAVGAVFGTNTPQSYIIENIVGAKNAFTDQGPAVAMTAEQIYALEPDVIILPTFNGYHPARELLEAPYFESLKDLKAVKNHRVYAMPWSPMNCAYRVEYPLDMLIVAKASYPELFADVNIYDVAIKFYQDVYDVDSDKAKDLAKNQILNWMKKDDF